MSSRDERELTGPVDTAELSRTTTEEDRLLANMAGEGFNDEASYNDENVEYELDDDPDAEGDDPVAAKPPEPSYKKANAIPFFVVCKKMEDLWQLKGRNGKKPKYKPNEEQKLRHFLPPKLMQSLAESADGRTNESIFPLFRLLMPDQDASRRVMLKEALLANIYGEAFGMPKGSGDRQKLEHFTDAQKFPAGAQVGDFSVVLQRVIEPRFEDPTKGSKLTVGEMNALLDELASLSGKDNNSKDTLRKRRGDWVGKLIKKHVSPLEHKWLTRIIMGKMEFGLGYKPLLRWYHPLAITLWTSHNSLKAVCNKLCDAESAEIRAMMTGEKDANGGKEQVGLASYMPTFRLPIKIGVYFSPMKSERTGFQRVLSDVSKRHRGFLESEEGKGLGVDWSLAVKHPAFCIETKLDGDRMLVHIQRGGIVKIHSRSANWFSNIYSPVLGPAIRKAVEKYRDLDIILDGEVIAWDNTKQETVPFGNNRTIAKFRHKYMKERGECDARDEGLHKDDTDQKAMNEFKTSNGKTDEAYEMAGAECWLQFIAFDVVYIDGPGAADLLNQSVSQHVMPRPEPGPIIYLDSFERKKLLYRLVEVQKHHVEIVSTVVVRPDGRTAEGSEYFAPDPVKEYGFPAYTLDSIDCALHGVVPGLQRIDVERRRGLSDQQISQCRANAVDKRYKEIVEAQRLEGLLFKDLATPYVLGDISKSLRYWHKFKPDYFNGSSASDLDLVIIGAYFATGLRLAGSISAFLVACVDSEDTSRFVPCCKVSAASLIMEVRHKILNKTGFKKSDGDDELELGKWFRDETVPDFVGQGSTEDGGWRVAKKDYPDLWIHPEDSAVAVINAGEITYSSAFPLGLTLRFPRITRIREHGDSKEPEECEKDIDLWKKFNDIEAQRSSSEGVAGLVPGSPAPSAKYKACRFLTEDQFLTEQKKKKTRVGRGARVVEMVPKPSETKSKALDGLSFTVLDGGYSLKESIDVDEAKEQGWEEEASLVKNSATVKTFIMKHGGTIKLSAGEDTFVLGGRETDARVRAVVNAVAAAKGQTKKGGTAKTQTKKALQYQMMAQHEGVLRWTFVYSLVHRWLSKENTDKTASIKDTDPSMLKPTVFDYLATADNSEPCFGEISSGTLLRRAMDIVSSSKRKSDDNTDKDTRSRKKISRWQTIALEALKPNERWILSCRNQPLWPYTKEGDDSKVASVVILYPDVFGFDFGLLSESGSTTTTISSAENGADGARWKRANSTLQPSGMASLLPLARVMGAFVTPHLHAGVTHVLCELGQGTDFIVWTKKMEPSCFRDPARGQPLLNRLVKLDADRTGDHPVALVSAKWIRDMWKERK